MSDSKKIIGPQKNYNWAKSSLMGLRLGPRDIVFGQLGPREQT